MHSNFEIVDVAFVECTTSTSGNLECASITTKRCSPIGKGPQKSMCTVHHGSGGNEDSVNGSGLLSGPLA